LVRIYQAIKPSFTILDGILAMEGEGPGKGGRPIELGILLGSTDAAALDAVVCRLLGLDEEALPTNRAARRSGMLEGPVEVVGDRVEIRDFQLPEASPLVFGPKFMHAFMRKHLVQRPVVEVSLCKSCRDCERYCPAQAIAINHEKGIEFDYDQCIRCYCCLEVCPHGALRTCQPLLGRIFARIINRPF
jgi:Pyruvate/2-oxoacid:ferredoxin oxidoreductase delta subunit